MSSTNAALHIAGVNLHVAEAAIRVPPAKTQDIQALLIATCSRFLQKLVPDLSAQNMRFLCEPWLHFFVHSALHRQELYGSPVPCVRDVASYTQERKVPGDTLSFFEYFRTSQYRQYLDETLAAKNAMPDCRIEVHLMGEQASRLASTVCYKPCFPRDFRYRLKFYSFGRIGFISDRPTLLDVPTDWGLRAALAAEVRAALFSQYAELADWLAVLAAELCPKSIFEHLHLNYVEKCGLVARQTLFSADAWHIIDDWKIYALAQKIQHGASWVGAPNALSHGSLAVFWQREFEVSHLDRYLTWGWSREGVGRVQSFYSPHYAGRLQAVPARTTANTGILISAAARPQHLLEYPYTPERFEDYLRTQLALAAQAHALTRQPITIRTRPRDLGWDVKAMVNSLANSEVTLEFQHGKFIERLKQCRLHICDNCSTTIAESLWANHPTLILISDDYFQLHPEAIADYQVLASVGIFHASIESLLNQLARLEGDFDVWWRESTTQAAIRHFLETQGRTGSSLKDWLKALL